MRMSTIAATAAVVAAFATFDLVTFDRFDKVLFGARVYESVQSAARRHCNLRSLTTPDASVKVTQLVVVVQQPYPTRVRQIAVAGRASFDDHSRREHSVVGLQFEMKILSVNG
jgi:hypothetical protein